MSTTAASKTRAHKRDRVVQFFASTKLARAALEAKRDTVEREQGAKGIELLGPVARGRVGGADGRAGGRASYAGCAAWRARARAPGHARARGRLRLPRGAVPRGRPGLGRRDAGVPHLGLGRLQQPARHREDVLPLRPLPDAGQPQREDQRAGRPVRTAGAGGREQPAPWPFQLQTSQYILDEFAAGASTFNSLPSAETEWGSSNFDYSRRGS